MRRLALLLLPLLVLVSCDAHKVLVVFPAPSASHGILGEGYVRHLLNAGHEVTYIASVPVKNPYKNFRQIDVSSNFAVFPAGDILDLTKLMNKEIPQIDTDNMLPLMLAISNNTVFNEDVQRLLHDPKEQFDVVIAEWLMNEVYSGIASVFNCPLIWSSSMEPHALVLSLMAEDPNPAYVTGYSSTAVPPFTFKQRLVELWSFLSDKYLKWRSSYKEAAVFEAAFSSSAAVRGHALPSYYEAKFNASLMLGNSHAAAGSALSLPQSYIPIAGYHIEETVKPLPQNLQNIMDSSKNGVIYFSMGSILKSKTIPAEMKSELIKMFSQLKQTVIWKLEESLEKLPKNVHLMSFAPQQSILAHPNCLLFITHGGLLSNTEALHFGVPIIGVPVFADQFPNIDRAVNKGYAKRVDLEYDFPLKLKEAIEDVLTNPKYRARVTELSFAYHDRVTPPGRALAHWVSHVVHTRGAPHLRSPALLLPWYKKMYLDLLAIILIVLVLCFFFIKQLTWSRKNNDDKKNN